MPERLTVEAEVLAAEYVLGTLDANERTQAHSLLTSDESFAARVRLWERRLSELHLMVEPVDPDPEIWSRIKGKLPDAAPVVASKPQPEAEAEAEAAPDPEPHPTPVAQPEAALGLAAPSEDDARPAVSDMASVSSAPPSPPASAAATFDEAVAAAMEPLLPDHPPPEVPEPAAEPAFEPATPSIEATPRTLVEPALSPPVVEPAAAPPTVVSASAVGRAEPRDTEERTARILRRRLRRWRLVSLFLMLLVLGVAGLIAAWRYAPDRLPPTFQAAEVMRRIGVSSDTATPPPLRPPPPPPESQIDE
ncbi:MAG: hypothetical protein ACJ8F3_02275 [Xanthobacteraceae bacterium]